MINEAAQDTRTYKFGLILNWAVMPAMRCVRIFRYFGGMELLIMNGPNLNLLGKREPDTYGADDLESVIGALRLRFPNHKIEHFQSNIEGELIDTLQQADGKYQGVILNAGGYTHTSVALTDAVAAISVPVIEVHISNIHAREEFRHKSLLSPNCLGSICGLGTDVYRLAVEHFLVQEKSD